MLTIVNMNCSIVILLVIIFLLLFLCRIQSRSRFTNQMIMVQFSQQTIVFSNKTIHNVPQNIFTSWVGLQSDPVPEYLANNWRSIQELNPSWNFIVFRDDMVEDLLAQYPYAFSLYKKINPSYGAARADFFRYIIMYEIGGVWMDAKSCTDIPLNDMIKSSKWHVLLCGTEKPCTTRKEIHCSLLRNKKEEIEQWAFIAQPKHVFLKAVIDKLFDKIQNSSGKEKGLDVVSVTGPVLYTNAMCEMMHKYPKDYIIEIAQNIGFRYVREPESEYKKIQKALHKTKYYDMHDPIIIKT